MRLFNGQKLDIAPLPNRLELDPRIIFTPGIAEKRGIAAFFRAPNILDRLYRILFREGFALEHWIFRGGEVNHVETFADFF